MSQSHDKPDPTAVEGTERSNMEPSVDVIAVKQSQVKIKDPNDDEKVASDVKVK